MRSLLYFLILTLTAWVPLQARSAPGFQDDMAQRTLACTGCHGQQGRAGPDGYYPRLAGKPVGYLYNQLLNFRDGRRHYGLMAGLVEPLSDAYLMEIAQYFSQLDAPYPPPVAATATASVLAQGQALVTRGDVARKIPACVQCHGPALTGAAPNVPGLLGLPRDYLNAQLGGWQTGQRRAHAPDCMATIAKRLTQPEVAAVAQWLAAQPVPNNAKPLPTLPPLAPNTTRPDCGSAALAPAATQAVAPAPTAPSTQATRGAYLARAGNCMHCHTVQGGVPYAGGRGIQTPFGTVYSSNLSSDPTHGIGRWSADDFWQALHQGRSKDGRLLYPAFPYTSFTQVSRADSDALFAFFKTIAPSPQPNQTHDLRWPYSTQTALLAWRTLYFKPGAEPTVPNQSAQWSRGAYLVRGLGHCAECHTPRDALGGLKTSLDLAGSLLPLQNWYAPTLRSNTEAGMPPATAAQIRALLQTGTSTHSAALGPMADVVRYSTQYLQPDDLDAISVYLQSLAAPRSRLASTAAAQPAVAPSVRLLGAKIYDAQCAQCHGKQGEGVPGAYPALAGSRAVVQPVTANLVQVVLYGGFAPVTQGNPRPFGMPPYVLQLSDAQTAAVLTHIRSSWGNQAGAVTELEVGAARTKGTR
jgi:cytochrome c553